MQVSRVACRASSMMKTARSPLQKTTQTKTKNRGGEARGAPKLAIIWRRASPCLSPCLSAARRKICRFHS
jgi:hypothetical protein